MADVMEQYCMCTKVLGEASKEGYRNVKFFKICNRWI
jgi:hypothetical protein